MSTNREDSSNELTSDDEPHSGLEPQQTQSATAWPVLPPPYSSPEEEESETDSDSDLMQRPMIETHLKPMDDSNLRFMLVKINPATTKKSEKSERKSSLFKRIWSEDDEIVILKGMIEYLAKYKTDPTNGLDVFHSLIREELQMDGSRAQLIDKIRRMRKKFEKKIESGKEVIAFSNPHEQRVYDLSKMIWGEKEKEKAVTVDGRVVRRSGRKKGSAGEVVEKKRRRVEAVTVDERMLMDGGDLFESGEGGKGEEEWKKLRMRKKFEKKIESGKEVMAFSKPHEQRVYDLSKMIWGEKGKEKEKVVAVDGCVVRRSGRKKGSTGEVVEKKRRRVEAVTVEERMLMDGGDLFESGKGDKGEEEWKKLRVEEVQIYLKQLEVRVLQIKLVLAALMKQS